MAINRDLRMRQSPLLLNPQPLFHHSKFPVQPRRQNNILVRKRQKGAERILREKRCYLFSSKKELNSPVSERPNFFLDCCRISESRLPKYDGLRDSNLFSLFSRPAYKKHINRFQQIVLELRLASHRSQGHCTPFNRNREIDQSNIIPFNKEKTKIHRMRGGGAATECGRKLATPQSRNLGIGRIAPLSSDQLKGVITKYKAFNDKPIQLNASFMY